MKTKICKIEGCNNEVLAKELCNTHYLRQRRHGSTDRPKYVREKLVEQGLSYCPKCNKTKPLDDFNKDVHAAFGIAIYCKKCNRKKGRKRYQTHKNEHKNNQLKNDFGISLNEYNEMLKQQNDKCAICGKSSEENKPMLAVDHDHKTNKVRGLLCSSCNNGLGRFFDNTEYLTNAIKYLQFHNA
jgi:hypothetical protein